MWSRMRRDGGKLFEKSLQMYEVLRKDPKYGVLVVLDKLKEAVMTETEKKDGNPSVEQEKKQLPVFLNK
jgi:hypothetical protein